MEGMAESTHRWKELGAEAHCVGTSRKLVARLMRPEFVAKSWVMLWRAAEEGGCLKPMLNRS